MHGANGVNGVISCLHATILQVNKTQYFLPTISTFHPVIVSDLVKALTILLFCTIAPVELSPIESKLKHRILQKNVKADSKILTRPYTKPK